MPSQTLWINKVTNNRSRFLCAINLFSMGCTVAPRSKFFQTGATHLQLRDIIIYLSTFVLSKHLPQQRHQYVPFYHCFGFICITEESLYAFPPLSLLGTYNRENILCLSASVLVIKWHVIPRRLHSGPFYLCLWLDMKHLDNIEWLSAFICFRPSMWAVERYWFPHWC